MRGHFEVQTKSCLWMSLIHIIFFEKWCRLLWILFFFLQNVLLISRIHLCSSKIVKSPIVLLLKYIVIKFKCLLTTFCAWSTEIFVQFAHVTLYFLKISCLVNLFYVILRADAFPHPLKHTLTVLHRNMNYNAISSLILFHDIVEFCTQLYNETRWERK